MTRFLQIFLLPFFLCLAGSAWPDEIAFSYVKAQDGKIVDDKNNPVFLRGVAFGNRVWNDDRIPSKHHNKTDYSRVHDMGMNLVRFYINYKTLENDAAPYEYLDDGWQWLDNNVAWARENGIYLLLNMHIPQGGFQSQGKGWDLWQKPELQNRLIALWKAIAERYKNEPVILGYDLVNEPGVPKNKQQWQILAQQLTNEIRKVDQNHPIFIERVNSINRKWENDADMNFVTVSGENIIYTFHSYDPYFYTHQKTPWDDYMKNREGGPWPNPKKGYSRAYLEKLMDSYLAWGKRNNATLYLGEWGLYKVCYEENRGGLNYIKDMLSILQERKLSNTFHTYHEESFGLYRGDGELDPNNVHKDLLDLFVQTYVPQTSAPNVKNQGKTITENNVSAD